MGFARTETENKQRKLVSKAQRNRRKILVNFFKLILVSFIAVIIAGAGAAFGMMKGILDGAPSVDDINIIPKGFRTVIYDQDGHVKNEIATINSNRVYVYYEDIPEDWVNAFVAIEDQRFWTHNGIDVRGIFRAAIHGVSTGEFDQGASTITQQLIKNHVFNVGMDEKSFLDKVERKIQEQYLALELEKKYDKKQILEYYLNTIYLGSGTHGIQAAAEAYFDKDIDELTISEIAVIAGITQNPYLFDPTVYPEENAKRRDLVLNKMLELEYITQEQYDVAKADDVYTRIAEIDRRQKESYSVNSYYTDALLDAFENDLMDLYGLTKSQASIEVFTGGYSIYSVQDDDIQAILDEELNKTDYYYEGTSVALKYQLTLIDDNKELKNYSLENLLSYYKEQTGNPKYNDIYPDEASARAAADVFKEAMLEETGAKFHSETYQAVQQQQFTMTIIDQHNGYVKAIFGGRGEKIVDRGFNRATMGKRQAGSTFKILAAYTPYIDACGGSLASPFLDEEYYYTNGIKVSNYWGSTYRGYNTVRKAIEDSMNVIAVKAITEATPEVAYKYLIDYGFTTLVDNEVGDDGTVYSDINQSTALGGLTYGVTNLEITAAYATIANGGVYNKPVFYSKVVDHDGNVIIDNTTPTSHTVMKPTTAWLLLEAMRTTLTVGTGNMAHLRSGVSCAGKTGTTSSNYDLWFCGMTPYYTGAVWMGCDSNVDLARYGTNAPKCMWRDVMDRIAELEGQDTSRVIMERPDGIGTITLCQISGDIPIEGCPTFTDYCATGTFQGGTCAGHEPVKLCKESKKIATNTCPETVDLVIKVNKDGTKEFVGDDNKNGKDYPYTEDVCDLHPEQAEQVTITSSAGEGGTISSSVTVDKGTTITFFITPYSGYTIADVIVNGASVGPKTSYTFTDVQENATISVTFKGGGGTTPQPPPPTTGSTAPTTEVPTEAPTEAPVTVAPTEAPAQ